MRVLGWLSMDIKILFNHYCLISSEYYIKKYALWCEYLFKKNVLWNKCNWILPHVVVLHISCSIAWLIVLLLLSENDVQNAWQNYLLERFIFFFQSWASSSYLLIYWGIYSWEAKGTRWTVGSEELFQSSSWHCRFYKLLQDLSTVHKK